MNPRKQAQAAPRASANLLRSWGKDPSANPSCMHTSIREDWQAKTVHVESIDDKGTSSIATRVSVRQLNSSSLCSLPFTQNAM